MKASSVLALSLACLLTALVGCSDGDSGTDPTSPPAAAGSANGGKAGAGSKAGAGGKASAGSSSSGAGGSLSGAGGEPTGEGGASSGAGGEPTGSGSATAGSGGATAGTGGMTAGAGGSAAGGSAGGQAGGATAGSGGAMAGSGGAMAGSGGSPGGAGTPLIIVGKITGATSEEVTMIAEGVQLANTTMATACFKDFVLAAKWTETEGLTQEQIWQKLCSGPVQVDVDMYLGSWYQNHVSKTIGYENEPGVVHMNRYFVDTPYMVADNIIHEAEGHSQGFSHYGVKSTSVPYGLNNAFEKCSPVDP